MVKKTDGPRPAKPRSKPGTALVPTHNTHVRLTRTDDADGGTVFKDKDVKHDDLVLDVYVNDVGKVLSVGTTNGVDRLIGMMPGPWEALFGLPERSWSPAVARRLARRSA